MRRRSQGGDGIRLGPNVVNKNIVHLVLATNQLFFARGSDAEEDPHFMDESSVISRHVLDLCGEVDMNLDPTLRILSFNSL